MHAHLHRHTCLSHARTHTRSNATVVTGFCSSFPLAEFPFPLFSVILLRLLRQKNFSRKKQKKSYAHGFLFFFFFFFLKRLVATVERSC